MAIYIPPPGEEFARNIQLIINLRQLDEDVAKNHMLKGSLFRDIGKTKEATEEYNKGLGRGAMSDLLAGTQVGNFLGIQPKLKESMFAAEPEPTEGAPEEYVKDLGENISKFGQTSIKEQQKVVGQNAKKWEEMFPGAKPVTPMGPSGQEVSPDELKWVAERNKQRLAAAGKGPTYSDLSGSPESPFHKYAIEEAKKRATHNAWEKKDWNAQAQYQRAFAEYEKSGKTADDYNEMMLKTNIIDEKFGWDVAQKLKWQFPGGPGGGKGDYMAAKFNPEAGEMEYRMITRGESEEWQNKGWMVQPAGKSTPEMMDLAERTRADKAASIFKDFQEVASKWNLGRESSIAKSQSELMRPYGREIVKNTETGEWEMRVRKDYNPFRAASIGPNLTPGPPKNEEKNIEVAGKAPWYSELYNKVLGSEKKEEPPKKTVSPKVNSLIYKKK